MNRYINNRSLAIVLILMMICSMMPMGVFANDQVKGADQMVTFAIDRQNYSRGEAMIDTDVAPYLKDDRTMVPVTFVASALGTDRAVWNPETRMVTIQRGSDLIVITIGSNELLVNGKPLAMDTVAEIKDVGGGGGRTMLPIAFIARALTVGYDWDGTTRSVDFYGYSEDYSEPGTFGPEAGTETIYGNVIVSSEDVRLQNKNIKGHLIIEKSERTGDKFLDNISVEGNMYVRGNGNEKIHINGGSFSNIEIEADNTVFNTEGETTIQSIVLNNRSAIKIAKGTKVGHITINAAANIEGEGTVETANVNANDVVILTSAIPGLTVATGINQPITEIAPPPPVITGGGGGGGSSEPTSTPVTGLTVTGDAMVGKTLTATPTPLNATGNYQWQVSDNGTDGWATISGATSSTYVITPGYASDYIRVSITGTGNYSGTQISDATAYIQESTDAGLISVFGQTDSNPGGNGETSDTPFTWEIDVGNAVEEATLADIEIAMGASVGIYADGNFSQNSISEIPLTEGGSTIAYIKVTAQDTSARYYAVTINRAGGSEFAGGTGTQEDPYQVANAEQLDAVRHYMDKHFVQTADIDLGVTPWSTGEGWVPIGHDPSTNRFHGYFDGDGYTINNLTINRNNLSYVGLFGVVGFSSDFEQSAQFRNVTLTNVQISGTSLHTVGSLIGFSNSGMTVIDNCSATGIITHNSGIADAIGGLIGSSQGSTVQNCHAEVNITGSTSTNKTGGLVASTSGKIFNSYAQGIISGERNAGGLVGWNSGEIRECFSLGTISGKENIGGLVGMAWGTIEESFSAVEVQGETKVGGLAGSAPGRIYNSYATGNTGGISDTGGLAGFFSGGGSSGEIVNCYASGKVTGSSNMGGLIGSIWTGSSGHIIEKSYYCENTGQNDTGKGVRKTLEDMISESTFITEGWNFNISDGVWATKTASYPYLQWQAEENIPYPPSPFAGGSGTELDPYQVADAEQLDAVRHYLDKHFVQTADINLGVSPWNEGEGWEPIGSQLDTFRGSYNGNEYTISNLYINLPSGITFLGLFGYSQGVISSCSVTGIVNGYEQTGLLVGRNNGSIINSSVIGEVSGTYNVGGLVGSNINLGVITGSYSEVKVSSSGDIVGGFAGFNSGKIDECYSKGDVEGIKRVGGLVGANTGDIEESFSSGKVTGDTTNSDTDSGGLVGVNTGNIDNSYSLGNVAGYRFVGGLVGRNRSDSVDGNISNSYSTGTVTGTAGVGGLIGYNPGNVTSSYWDTVSAGISTSAGGEGKETADMITMSTYTDWDFPDTWTINTTDNDGYPALAWQGFTHLVQ